MSTGNASVGTKRTLKYEKGLSRPKDTNAPKRPLTAYFQWAAENREAAKGQCSSQGVAEVTKKLGDMWAALGADEKEKWESKSKGEMEVYKTKFEAYKKTKEYENHEKELREYNIKMTYKPFGKDENMPKKALSTYMLFAADERPRVASENPDAKVTEVMGLVAKAWKELSDADKKPYQDKAKVLSDKHAKAAEKYKASKEHATYLKEKQAYDDRMAAKRHRLMKQAGMEVVAGKGSGATPNAKRVKKKSEPKKKKSAPKKSSNKKSSKKKTPSKKKRSAPKKSSKPKKKSGSKKSSKSKSSAKK